MTSGPEAPEVDPKVAQDPAVIQEEVRLQVRLLRLQYYQEVAKTIAVALQTFKSEAVSLMSGLGTLVVGWYQIRKWVAQGRTEIKAIGRAQGRVEGRAAERAERKEDRQEAKTSSVPRVQTAKKTVVAKPLKAQVKKTAVPAPLVEEVAIPAPMVAEMPTNPFFDPVNSMTVVFPVIFVGSSVFAWFKRKKKLAELGGRRNGAQT